MSASTGTIQRPFVHGSPIGALAVAIASVCAAAALAWGALNMTATKGTAAPVAAPAPATLDKGSRFELPKVDAPVTAPRYLRAS